MPEARTRLLRIESALARNAAWVSSALFLVALLPRVYVATHWAHEPVWDGQYYHAGAQSIAEGHGYSGKSATDHGTEWHPWSHYPVGYSAFLAVFYKIFGANVVVGTLAGALLGALTVVVVHRLALTRLTHIRALFAATICLIHPGLILYAGLLMTEPLAAVGIVLAPLVYLKVSEWGGKHRPVLGAVAAGLVLGLTTLVRPQSILGAPLIGLFARTRVMNPVSTGEANKTWKRSFLRPIAEFRWDPKSSLRALVVALVATVACVVAVLPWTVRNCMVMDGCAFVSTNGGWNLAIGSSPHATGRFDAISGADGCREVTGQVQQDHCWFDQGEQWIRNDPARYIALAPKKLAFTFDHQSFPVGYLSQAEPESWPEERRSKYRKLLSSAQYILIGLAALGVSRRPRAGLFDVVAWLPLLVLVGLFATGVASDPPTLWIVAVVMAVVGGSRIFDAEATDLTGYLSLTLAALIVIHAVFFGEDRYQIVITPALCLLAGGALSSARRASAPSSAAPPEPRQDEYLSGQ